MLDVLCGETELAEYGQVVEIGESIRRLGVQSREEYFGTGLDQIEYRFDRYAEVGGGLLPLAIAGEVHTIAAVYIRLAAAGGSLGPLPGSATLEPLRSTRETRRPVSGRRWGQPRYQDGDELLWGWRLTLTDAVVEPW